MLAKRNAKDVQQKGTKKITPHARAQQICSYKTWSKVKWIIPLKKLMKLNHFQRYGAT